MFKLLIRLFKKSKRESTLHWPANVDKWLEEDFPKSSY